ncbi:MAG: hypothetical protein ABF335_13225 [Alphaproteobacteria bacterium]
MKPKHAVDIVLELADSNMIDEALARNEGLEEVLSEQELAMKLMDRLNIAAHAMHLQLFTIIYEEDNEPGWQFH